MGYFPVGFEIEKKGEGVKIHFPRREKRVLSMTSYDSHDPGFVGMMLGIRQMPPRSPRDIAHRDGPTRFRSHIRRIVQLNCALKKPKIAVGSLRTREK